jgi:hypothetical protein
MSEGKNLNPPRNNAYTVLLAISLVAQIAACAILFNDLRRYPELKPGGNFTNIPKAKAP